MGITHQLAPICSISFAFYLHHSVGHVDILTLITLVVSSMLLHLFFIAAFELSQWYKVWQPPVADPYNISKTVLTKQKYMVELILNLYTKEDIYILYKMSFAISVYEKIKHPSISITLNGTALLCQKLNIWINLVILSCFW